ncbi:MAG: hypothetical protein PF517_17265 [Salinivirgaceae bacterium]|jgi:hypothetical protein|nr:hypothetical protein [Salinivirgaceae bacterium]
MSSCKIDNEVVQTVRKRRTDRNDEIQQLFQGAQPPTKNSKFLKGEVYPGDRYIKDDNKLTIQIHRLHLTDVNGLDILDDKSNIMYQDIPSIAIWIPEEIGKDIIRQPDNTL